MKLHTSPGQEVVADGRAHILDYELAMTSWFSGCQIRPADTPRGILTWDAIAPKLRKASNVFSATVRAFSLHRIPFSSLGLILTLFAQGLIAIENTHNMAGGTVYPLEVINDICARAHELHIPVHMDGARLFNASIASGIPTAEIVRNVDTVMFCLSKGLGAPAGSILAGSEKTLAGARSLRKRLGGGMRQVGVLAAAGIVALDTMVERLAEDHANAQYMARELADMEGLAVDVAAVQTNILFVDVSKVGAPVASIVEELKARNVLINNVGPSHLRIVTHFDAPRRHCEVAVEALREVVAKLRQ